MRERPEYFPSAKTLRANSAPRVPLYVTAFCVRAALSLIRAILNHGSFLYPKRSYAAEGTRRPFLSNYHRVQSAHQVELIVRELSSEERLATPIGIIKPNRFLRLEKRDVLAS